MHLTNEERETIILFNEADKTATCDTCNPSLIRKLDKLCLEYEEISVVRQDEYGKVYKFPKKWVKVNASVRLSDEQRQKMAERGRANVERLKAARKAKLQATASDENS